MSEIKIAVVGVGYLGNFHAEKIARMKGARLLAVVDKDARRAEKIGKDRGVSFYTDHKAVIDLVDGVVIATPTVAHAEVALDFLEAGKDVFCEKPLTATLAEADQLIETAARHNCLIQVGHLERFNPATEDMLSRITTPLFIECNRIAPFKARALDVDVALDLMIHDLEIILAMVGEDPCLIRAVGVPVLGEHADIVNARLEFPSGCVANVTASRLALKDERKMRVFQPDAYFSLDFRKRKLLIVRGVEYRPGLLPKVNAEKPRYPRRDPMEEELKAFVDSVQTRKPPRVDGNQGRRALACALEIQAKVKEGLPGHEELIKNSRLLVEAALPGQN